MNAMCWRTMAAIYQYLDSSTNFRTSYPHICDHPSIQNIISIPCWCTDHICVLPFQNRWGKWIWLLVWIYCLSAGILIWDTILHQLNKVYISLYSEQFIWGIHCLQRFTGKVFVFTDFLKPQGGLATSLGWSPAKRWIPVILK